MRVRLFEVDLQENYLLERSFIGTLRGLDSDGPNGAICARINIGYESEGIFLPREGVNGEKYEISHSRLILRVAQHLQGSLSEARDIILLPDLPKFEEDIGEVLIVDGQVIGLEIVWILEID